MPQHATTTPRMYGGHAKALTVRMGYKTEIISMVKNLTQEHIWWSKNFHGAELNTDQYTCYRDDTEWCMWCRAEKEEQHSIETIDYSTIIKVNRRISLQMITPVSTQHYDIHLGNNDGKQDDNVKKNIKKG